MESCLWTLLKGESGEEHRDCEGSSSISESDKKLAVFDLDFDLEGDPDLVELAQTQLMQMQSQSSADADDAAWRINTTTINGICLPAVSSSPSSGLGRR